MKLRSEVSAEKLRGGFYTPVGLVRHALHRLSDLLGARGDVSVLEPSVGDGAFVEGLAESSLSIGSFTGLDVDGEAVAVARQRLARHGIPGEIMRSSTLPWSLDTTREFDAVVGNLPFVRFQFVSAAERDCAMRHGSELGVPVAGVANLWLPMLLASLRRLRVGGAFALVLPAECFTGVSAGKARQWLLRTVDELRFDLYPPRSFPGALQEVVLLSGRRAEPSASETRPLVVSLHSTQHSTALFERDRGLVTRHTVAVNDAPWTALLLRPEHRDAVAEARAIPAVGRLDEIAKFEVATVTGANAYFSLNEAEVSEFDLRPWSRPLLARAKHAPGLRFTARDYRHNADSGLKVHLFDATSGPIERKPGSGLDRYLRRGEDDLIPSRFKCRIRQPWYRIPNIRHGELMLSKRSHHHPRVIVNDIGCVTTDTIYRGRITDGVTGDDDFAAAFHNSLTLLSAELEGRNFGGGVLELVPSEVGRLAVVRAPGMARDLPRLDELCRECAATGDPAVATETIVRETDLLLAKQRLGLTGDLLDRLREAHEVLRGRRLARSSSSD
ncbi:N-6 DNA methylase [Saccharomonospora sp. NPDC006951]